MRCSKTVSFFVHLTFTIYSRIIPSQIFAKKMAWVSPISPRADRPELLRYYLSAIMFFVSRTFYGPQILSIFTSVFSRFHAIFLAKNPEKYNLREHSKHTVSVGAIFFIFLATMISQSRAISSQRPKYANLAHAGANAYENVWNRRVK